MPKIAILGCGGIAQLAHLRLLHQRPDVELTACADMDPLRLEATSALFPKSRAYEDFRELLGTIETDAVFICLPTALHTEAACMAFEKHRHVYLEKPLAMNLEEGEKIIRAWKQSERIGRVGFNYRFNPLYKNLRQLVREGLIGKIISIRTIFSTTTGSVPGWKQNRSTGGGVLMEMGVHHLDLLRFISGNDPKSVYGNSMDASTVQLDFTFGDGFSAQCLFSSQTCEEDCIEVYGEFGKLRVDRYHSTFVEYQGRQQSGSRFNKILQEIRSLTNLPYLVKKLRSPAHEPSFALALDAFINEITRNLTVTSPDLDDGYRALKIIDAAEQSIHSGRKIEIAYE